MALTKGTDAKKLQAVARKQSMPIAKGSGPLPNPTGLTKGKPGKLTVEKGNTPGTPATTNPGPNAKPAAPSPVDVPTAPFLTPDQQQSLDDAWKNYSLSRNAAVNADSVAKADWTNGLQQAGQSHLVNTAKTNDAMAARGLFESSIRAGALNDIDATQTMQTNLLNTAWNTAHLKNMNDIGTLDTNWGQTQGNSDVQMIKNASDPNLVTLPTPAAPAAVLPAAGIHAAVNGAAAAGSSDSAAAGAALDKSKNASADASLLKGMAQQKAGAATPPSGATPGISKGIKGPTLTKVASGGAKLNG